MTPTPRQTPRPRLPRFWPQLRRFLIFQFKLYIDALRDFFLSFLSLLAFVLDVLLQSYGADSFFEKVLQLGRRSERAINLFEQYDPDQQDNVSVDGVLRGVAKRFSGERPGTGDERSGNSDSG